jgi:hypothetical protein
MIFEDLGEAGGFRPLINERSKQIMRDKQARLDERFASFEKIQNKENTSANVNPFSAQ